MEAEFLKVNIHASSLNHPTGRIEKVLSGKPLKSDLPSQRSVVMYGSINKLTFSASTSKGVSDP